MDVRDEIVARIEALPPELQEEVLVFVTSLESSEIKGKTGRALRALGGSLDPVSARQMAQAIEEECERVDASQR